MNGVVVSFYLFRFDSFILLPPSMWSRVTLVQSPSLALFLCPILCCFSSLFLDLSPCASLPLPHRAASSPRVPLAVLCRSVCSPVASLRSHGAVPLRGHSVVTLNSFFYFRPPFCATFDRRPSEKVCAEGGFKSSVVGCHSELFE